MASKTKDLGLCIEINLLPKEYRKKKKSYLDFIFDKRIVVSTLVLVLAIVCGYKVYEHVQETIQSMQNELDQKKGEVAANSTIVNKIKSLEGEISEQNQLVSNITRKRDALNQIQTNKKKWVGLFENISAVLPANMWISSLQQNGPNDVELRGTTYGFSEVAEYMVKLENQESITSVSLVTINTSKVEGEEAYTFTMRLKIGN